MCNKVILQNGQTLVYVPDCYKNQKMCNKAVDNHADALEFLPDCYKSQQVCKKAVETYPSAIQFVPESYKIQEICVKIFSENSFMLKYCLQKFVLDWFVTNKMISLFWEEIGVCAAIHRRYIMYAYDRV